MPAFATRFRVLLSVAALLAGIGVVAVVHQSPDKPTVNLFASTPSTEDESTVDEPTTAAPEATTTTEVPVTTTSTTSTTVPVVRTTAKPVETTSATARVPVSVVRRSTPTTVVLDCDWSPTFVWKQLENTNGPTMYVKVIVPALPNQTVSIGVYSPSGSTTLLKGKTFAVQTDGSGATNDPVTYELPPSMIGQTVDFVLFNMNLGSCPRHQFTVPAGN